MDRKSILLNEKRKYDLPETISEKELVLLEKGTPIQKIIGYIQFDKVIININRNVLIPRYETEEVILEALKYIKQDSNVLDLCTGSGFIGLTIKEKTNANVTMSDISDEAILQAKENAKLNNLDVEIIQSDLFNNIDDKFDVIVSNPPYIREDEPLPESVEKFEPSNALFGGQDGNDFYKEIIKQAPNYLKPNGILIFEIGKDNVEFMKQNNFEILDDINDLPRIAIKKEW